MGFDDLARHMAGRDKKKLSTATSADQLVAEAAAADRKLSRQRDLILGPISIVCGLAILGLLAVLYLGEAKTPADHAFNSTYYYSIGGTVLGFSMLGVGIKQTLRGVRASR